MVRYCGYYYSIDYSCFYRQSIWTLLLQIWMKLYDVSTFLNIESRFMCSRNLRSEIKFLFRFMIVQCLHNLYPGAKFKGKGSRKFAILQFWYLICAKSETVILLELYICKMSPIFRLLRHNIKYWINESLIFPRRGKDRNFNLLYNRVQLH